MKCWGATRHFVDGSRREREKLCPSNRKPQEVQRRSVEGAHRQTPQTNSAVIVSCLASV